MKDKCGKILIAEDNPVVNKLLESMLSEWGYYVSSVTNGLEALEALSREDFDLILLDYQMPKLNGLETLKLIQYHDNEAIAKIPIIFLTGEINNSKLGDLEKSGVNFFLKKPIHVEELNFTIQKLLNVKELKEIKGESSTRYLNKITSNNKSLMVEIIDVFFDETPKNLNKLKKYCLSEDWNSFKKLLHKIKANYSYVGIKDLENLIHDLELDVDRLLNIDTYLAKIDIMEEATNRSIIDLKKKRLKLLNKIQDLNN